VDDEPVFVDEAATHELAGKVRSADVDIASTAWRPRTLPRSWSLARCLHQQRSTADHPSPIFEVSEIGHGP